MGKQHPWCRELWSKLSLILIFDRYFAIQATSFFLLGNDSTYSTFGPARLFWVLDLIFSFENLLGQLSSTFDLFAICAWFLSFLRHILLLGSFFWDLLHGRLFRCLLHLFRSLHLGFGGPVDRWFYGDWKDCEWCSLRLPFIFRIERAENLKKNCEVAVFCLMSLCLKIRRLETNYSGFCLPNPTTSKKLQSFLRQSDIKI